MLRHTFTNEPIRESPTWQARTISLPLLDEGEGVGRIGRAWHNARLTCRSTTSSDLVIFSDSHNLTGSVCGLLWNTARQRATFVRTDPLLTPARFRLLSPLRKAYVQASLRTADCIIVWAPAVMDRYETHFGIPRQKMVAQRFHHTLQGYAFGQATPGDYIFTGGNSMRDYPNFIEAIRDIRIPVVIATYWKPPAGMSIPAHVSIAPLSHAEFRFSMAQARLVVFPLCMRNIRTSGQQSYLNAMAMGKPVIVTDPVDSPYYIEHGKTGLLTPEGDPDALRQAIRCLLDSPALARELGQAAQAFALPLDQEYTWKNVLNIALDAHKQRCIAQGWPADAALSADVPQ